MTVFALLGATALWLTYAWLASAIIASYLSGRKGYSERAGLASGLLLNVIGIVVWLIVPAKADSLWKKIGPWGQGERAELTPLKREPRGDERGSGAGPSATD